MAVTSKSNPDNAAWIVKTTTGKLWLKESFTSFKDANNAARKYTRETGQFAQAVRA